MDLENLTVDAIETKRSESRLGKLGEQASANVRRQQLAEEQRIAEGLKQMKGAGGGKKGASSSQQSQNPAAIAAAEEEKQKQIAAKTKELHLIQKKCIGYLNSPRFGPKLRDAGINLPRSGSIEDWKGCLEIIHSVVNSGAGEIAMKQMYLQILTRVVEPVASTFPPPHIRIPRGSHNYCAMQIQRLDEEFEQLSIEYGHLFTSSPLTRLMGKTLIMLTEYKSKVENGEMPELTPSGIADFEMSREEQQVSSSAASSSSSGSIRVPPPQHIYPEPQQHQHVFVEPSPPEFSSVPTCSSNPNLPILVSEEEEGVSFIKTESQPGPKSSRGKRSSRGGGSK